MISIEYIVLNYHRSTGHSTQHKRGNIWCPCQTSASKALQLLAAALDAPGIDLTPPKKTGFHRCLKPFRYKDLGEIPIRRLPMVT